MPCKALNRRGGPCGAPPLSASRFCFTHAPEKAAERALARRKGGLAVHGLSDGPTPDVRLEAVGDVLALLETAAAELLTRKAGVTKSRALAYVAGVTLRALEVGQLEERVAALEELARAT